MTLDDLDRGLGACRSLLGWKYPGNVWSVNAFRLQDFPVHLGRHRFGIWDDSAAVWWRHAAIELADYSSSAVAPIVRQFLMGSQPACLRVPRDCMEIGQGAAFSTPVGRSLNLAAEIHAAGSLKNYVVTAVHDHRALDPEVIPCFANFMAVHLGHQNEFVGFNVRQFLKGGVAGVARAGGPHRIPG